ncbi:hypothetical protein [Roseivirga sp. E12]|uniref:hypothetical protein n=1 Tax=Roseivirga sp. E12 TaxID=2819237 RepID=UPI001ABC0657|nr:hypothetical protein [Roseivirga sp. E12]MBO3699224.1 hypothetical protein [Roseivirga sp. E12]
MSAIAIQIPQVSGEQEIEVEVKVNGKKMSYNYRVEVFYWADCENPSEDRVDCIRQILDKYDSNWELYTIGMPTEELVPITFRRKRV